MSVRAAAAVAALAFGLGCLAHAQELKLLEATIDDVHASLSEGQMTCRELVDGYLSRIAAYDKQGPQLNAIQLVNPRAREEAEALDAAFESNGFVGPLHCVPVLLKDQVETSDMPTTYGSAVFSGFMSGRDATIVTRMKEAGAIILAKTNMGEYAFGYLGSAFGMVRNAYDPTRLPSGSSAGTGAAVAANFGLVGIGEDTGGSIRGPAAVHSLVGLRPTTPLVSRYGMMPANPTQDTLGPMTRTVADTAVLLDVLAGYDPNDPITAYSVGRVPESYQTFLDEDGLAGARIGVIREPMDPRADPESGDYAQVRGVIDRALEDMAALGAEIVDSVDIPLIGLVDSTYASNSFETEEATNDYLEGLPNTPVSSLREILLTELVVPSRVATLLNVVGQSTGDIGYLDVMLARERIRESVLAAMADADLDALVYATFDHRTTQIPADALTSAARDEGYGRGNNRRLSPLIGFPALTVPAGFTADGLPVGIEFLGRAFDEGTLLRFAYAYEQATNRRQPPTTTPAMD
ncbi:MAG: amidase [Gammaproteobacteria bacterium]|nr:amidase [Gammaproteobacteria bacterium]